MTRAAATPVPSVSKAIAILRLLGRGGEPMGVTAIARATGMGPSSAFNLVRTLVAEGLVDFDRTTKSYRIGMGSIDFARMALRSDGVVAAARPVMDALAEHYDAAIGLWRAASGERLLLLALAYPTYFQPTQVQNLQSVCLHPATDFFFDIFFEVYPGLLAKSQTQQHSMVQVSYLLRQKRLIPG